MPLARSVDFLAGAALCEPRSDSKCRFRGGRRTLCEPRSADFRGRREPRRADFVAGTALCEARSADFVAGAALCEPRSVDFAAALHFVNLEVQISWQAGPCEHPSPQTVPV